MDRCVCQFAVGDCVADRGVAGEAVHGCEGHSAVAIIDQCALLGRNCCVGHNQIFGVVHVGVVGQQINRHGCIEVGRVRVIHGNRSVVHRRHGHNRLPVVGRAIGIGDGVGDRGLAVEVRRGCEGHGAVAIVHNAALLCRHRNGCDLKLFYRVIGIGVIAAQINDHGRVFLRRGRVIHRNRRINHRRHSHNRLALVALAVGVGDRVGDRRVAVELRRGREGHGAVAVINHGALIRRYSDIRQRQLFQRVVRIKIIAAQVHDDRGILLGRRNIVKRNGGDRISWVNDQRFNLGEGHGARYRAICIEEFDSAGGGIPVGVYDFIHNTQRTAAGEIKRITVITACAALNHITSVTTDEQVGIVTAGKTICPCTARDRIVAAFAEDRVIARIAREVIVAELVDHNAAGGCKEDICNVDAGVAIAGLVMLDFNARHGACNVYLQGIDRIVSTGISAIAACCICTGNAIRV